MNETKILIEFNGMFQKFILESDITSKLLPKLPTELLEIIGEGLYLSPDELLTFKSLSKIYGPLIDYQEFGNKSSYECFLNKVYINSNQELMANICLGLICILKIYFKILGSDLNTKEIIFILNTDDIGCYVTFHLYRETENWLANDLNDYKDDGVLRISTNSIK
ncbi:MAG TPA: hypothetical protein PLJ00_15830 [Chitinophagales bacterium]|nr:hypothetical protein [Chitinophagales bacterium]